MSDKEQDRKSVSSIEGKTHVKSDSQTSGFFRSFLPKLFGSASEVSVQANNEDSETSSLTSEDPDGRHLTQGLTMRPLKPKFRVNMLESSSSLMDIHKASTGTSEMPTALKRTSSIKKELHCRKEDPEVNVMALKRWRKAFDRHVKRVSLNSL